MSDRERALKPVLIRWLLVALAMGVCLSWLRFDTNLESLLPTTDPLLVANARFFEQRGAAQIMALEVGGDDQDAAVAFLRTLPQQLEPFGVSVLADAPAGAALVMADQIQAHLPHLLEERRLQGLQEEITVEALEQRLRGVVAMLRQGDQSMAAPFVYRDLLGLGHGVLAALRESETGIDPQHGIALADDGRHALMLIDIAFPPANQGRTQALMDELFRIRETAHQQGFHFEPIGSYRHFAENNSQILGTLFTSLPISLILIALMMWSLLRRPKAIVALHLPAVAAILGGLVAIVGLFQGQVPLILVGFCSGILGIAVDYGLHMAHGCMAGSAHAVRRPLILSFCTSGAAFLCLAFSPIPAIQGIGVFLVAGLFMALMATLDLVPAVVGTQKGPSNLRWQRIVDPIHAWLRKVTWRRWIVVVLLVALAIPGLMNLRFSTDLRDYDGSTAETKAALATFEKRWGMMGGSNFIVAEATSTDEALAKIAATKERHRIAPSLAEVMLPDAARQQARVLAWNSFWNENADLFAHNLGEACSRVSIRPAAFQRSIDAYHPVATTGSPVTFATWDDTPMATILGRLKGTTEDGLVQVASPLVDRTPSETSRIVQSLTLADDPDDAWLASRRVLAQRLVGTVRGEFLSRGLLILSAMTVAVVILLRTPRRILAVFLPPVIALMWCFGFLGWIGVELLPFHVLVAAFISGIGIDDALFMAQVKHRRHSIAPILGTTFTTIFGIGAMSLASNPILHAIGIAIVAGMVSCLVSCMLLGPLILPEPKDDGP